VRIYAVLTARQQLREAITWWRANRPAAPNAITVELRGLLRLLRAQPQIGTRTRDAGFEDVRRVLLTRVDHHVYYRVRSDKDAIEIVAFWHARRGSSPLR
jgi:plasmid stabilization system protein ParE